MAKNLEDKVAELKADKHHFDTAMSVIEKELAGLKKYKKESDVAMEKLQKVMAELRGGRSSPRK